MDVAAAHVRWLRSRPRRGPWRRCDRSAPASSRRAKLARDEADVKRHRAAMGESAAAAEVYAEGLREQAQLGGAVTAATGRFEELDANQRPQSAGDGRGVVLGALRGAQRVAGVPGSVASSGQPRAARRPPAPGQPGKEALSLLALMGASARSRREPALAQGPSHSCGRRPALWIRPRPMPTMRALGWTRASALGALLVAVGDWAGRAASLP